MENISKAAKANIAQYVWNVGDVFEIENTLTTPAEYYKDSSTTKQLKPFAWKIIGFNHNAEYEGDNTIHFQATEFTLSDIDTISDSYSLLQASSLPTSANSGYSWTWGNNWSSKLEYMDMSKLLFKKYEPILNYIIPIRKYFTTFKRSTKTNSSGNNYYVYNPYAYNAYTELKINMLSATEISYRFNVTNQKTYDYYINPHSASVEISNFDNSDYSDSFYYKTTILREFIDIDTNNSTNVKSIYYNVTEIIKKDHNPILCTISSDYWSDTHQPSYPIVEMFAVGDEFDINNSPMIILSKNKVKLNNTNPTDDVYVNLANPSNGEVTIKIEKRSVCSAVYDNDTKTIHITQLNMGCSNVLVETYNTELNRIERQKILVISAGNLSETLNNNSPALILKAARLGIAPYIWKIGDRVNIELNGTVGELTFNKYNVSFSIIGFNHNSKFEGDNTIHFEIVTPLKDSKWSQEVSESGYFAHHTENTNIGGWASSDIRTIICPQFFNCLPEMWQNVIKAIPKYNNNSYVGVRTSDVFQGNNLTITTDKIWIRSKLENDVFLSRDVNDELLCQKPYHYSINSNNIFTLFRTVNIDAVNIDKYSEYCRIDDQEWANYFGSKAANTSLYFAPCFAIG